MFSLAFKGVKRYLVELPFHCLLIIIALAMNQFILLILSEFLQFRDAVTDANIYKELLPMLVGIALILVYSIINIMALYTYMYNADKRRYAVYKMCGASPAKVAFISALSYIVFAVIGCGVAVALTFTMSPITAKMKLGQPKDSLYMVGVFALINVIYLIFQTLKFKKSAISNIQM